MRLAQLNLFVYGTLRPGGALFDTWLSRSIISHKRAVTDGAMYSVGAYPVVFFDQPGTVIGDVCTVAMTPEVIDCMQMEVHAGYECVDIEYCVMQNGVRVNGTGERAFAFHCRANTYRLEEHVRDGDWLTWDATHPRRAGGSGRLQARHT